MWQRETVLRLTRGEKARPPPALCGPQLGELYYRSYRQTPFCGSGTCISIAAAFVTLFFIIIINHNRKIFVLFKSFIFIQVKKLRRKLYTMTILLLLSEKFYSFILEGNVSLCFACHCSLDCFKKN